VWLSYYPGRAVHGMGAGDIAGQRAPGEARKYRKNKKGEKIRKNPLTNT